MHKPARAKHEVDREIMSTVEPYMATDRPEPRPTFLHSAGRGLAWNRVTRYGTSSEWYSLVEADKYLRGVHAPDDETPSHGCRRRYSPEYPIPQYEYWAKQNCAAALQTKARSARKTAVVIKNATVAATERAKLFMLIRLRARSSCIASSVRALPVDIWLEIHRHVNELTTPL
jgi:hypothetical protein